MNRFGANSIPVAVPVVDKAANGKMLDLVPGKLVAHHTEGNNFYNQILTQKEVYEGFCKQFKDLLGEEDFLELNKMPFWNDPKSDEFRSQFINNRRPIIKTLAQERLKLWELLTKYSQQISSIDAVLQGILSRDISHSFSISEGKASISEGSNEFHVSIGYFQKYAVNPSYLPAFGAQLQPKVYLCGSKITLHLSIDHIIEDDEGIRKAKIAKFQFDRYNEFVEFLKTLCRKESDEEVYEGPSLCLATVSKGTAASLYDTPFQRDQEIYLGVLHDFYDDISLVREEIKQLKLLVAAVQTRHANFEFCVDGRYKISW
eukprot:gene14489-16040_t